MSAVGRLGALLFSWDVYLPRGYALGWEPVVLIADGLGQLSLAIGGGAIALRALKRAALRSRALGVFGALVLAMGLLDLVGLWWSSPGLSALLHLLAGGAALWAARGPSSVAAHPAAQSASR